MKKEVSIATLQARENAARVALKAQKIRLKKARKDLAGAEVAEQRKWEQAVGHLARECGLETYTLAQLDALFRSAAMVVS